MMQVMERPHEHLERRAPASGGSLAYTDSGGKGIAVVTPLCFGTTLAGLDVAHGQRSFLDAIGAGRQFVAYDQAGTGASRDAGRVWSWEQRGADLWAVADAAGIQRAVLYGVFDGGHTIAHAAAQQPDRVLGLIFNLVPPCLVPASDGGRAATAGLGDAWRTAGERPPAERTAFVLRALGLNEADARALAEAWARAETPEALKHEAALLREADLRSLVPSLRARALVIEPQRRPSVAGWGRALGSLLPSARVITPAHAGEMLGGIHGFLAMVDIEEGRHASRLSPAQSSVVGAAERSVASLRRIIVPVTESVASERAVEMACRLGAQQQAEIVLVHTVEIPLVRALDAVTEEERARGAKALALGEAIAARRGMRSRARLLVERSAAAGIVRAAMEEGADLIVMAMGEHRSLVPAELSQTMREVLRRAPCEVLINQAPAVRA